MAMKVGLVGCGKISGIYCRNLGEVFNNVKVAACADQDPQRARALAAQYPGMRAAADYAALLADPALEIIVNLTTPGAHFPLSLQALEAGKHVYGEKPLALNSAEGRRLLAAAERAGRRLGSAPDTFLGAGLQTCRELIDAGAIGTPVAAQAFMLSHGHETWHPDPDFYYQAGGGPVFDMGPYYLTALVALLGPARRVTASARITFPRRLITSEPRRGQYIEVKVPTHVAGVIDFASGVIGTLTTSFDVWASEAPRIEIFGTTGSLSVPDPNRFGGPVRLRRKDEDTWHEMPLTRGFTANGRGLGVSDMAAAIAAGRPHRAGGELAAHVLDLMEAFHEASAAGRHVNIESTCERPEPLPPGLFDGRWR